MCLIDLLLVQKSINRENIAVSKSNVIEFENPVNLPDLPDPLTDMLKTGARQLIHGAVEAELKEFMEQFQDRRLENGRAAVIRNGYQPERQLQTGIGPVTVKIPKIRAKDRNSVTFNANLVSSLDSQDTLA